MKSGAGFTLIELLVVISVTGILSAIGIAAFVNYSRQQQVTQAVNDLKNNLRIAQGKALTQEIPSGCNSFSAYELKFADDGKSYTVYPICSLPGQPPVISINFPSTVSKVQGPDTIRFKILTGAVDGAGTITLSGFDKTMCIEITNVGRIQNLSSDLCSPSGIASGPTSSPSPTPTVAPIASPTPTPTPATLKIFVTNASYTGNLGRLSGADQKCQQAADAVPSLQGKLWRAWLSDSTVNAKDRISDGKYTLINGTTVVANNKADLLDGSIASAINSTETGGSPSIYGAESFPYVWTGTDLSGNKTANTCAGWDRPETANGTLGVIGSGRNWTAGSDGINQCQTYQRHLYCFEQPQASSTGGAGCLTAYQDFDNDGYTTGSAVYFCNTSSLPYGYKSSSSTTADCYDQNPNANPGQTQWFDKDRGDGSFDYNCDGNINPKYSNKGVGCGGYLVTQNSNCSFTSPTFTCNIGPATTASDCGQQGGWTGNSPGGWYWWQDGDCGLSDLADAANEKLSCR